MTERHGVRVVTGKTKRARQYLPTVTVFSYASLQIRDAIEIRAAEWRVNALFETAWAINRAEWAMGYAASRCSLQGFRACASCADSASLWFQVKRYTQS